MKRKMIFIAVAAIVMAACGGNKIQGDEAQVDPVMLDTLTKVEVPKEKVVIAPKKKNLWNKEAVDAQIRACFAEVNKMSDGVIDIEKLDEMFCSKDFLELKSMLEKKISKGEVMFEGKAYNAPADTDRYLKNLYGDYMKLPPKDQQIAHHFDIWEIKED